MTKASTLADDHIKHNRLVWFDTKRLQVVKVLSALHNGVVVESSSDQLHVAMRTNFLKKFVALRLKSVYSEKVAEINL